MSKHYNLIVVGGGYSGVAAAIAAAREGLTVLLIEKNGYLGGAATNCLVGPFMQFDIVKDGKSVIINRGIFTEILDRLKEVGGLNNTCFNEEFLKLILDRMCEENNIDVLFHTIITDVETDGNNIKLLKAFNKSGSTGFYADYFIDCSGDADIAHYAGSPFTLGREEDNLCQPMTLCFRLSNVDTDMVFNDVPGHVDISAIYQEFKKEDKIKNPRENVLLFKHLSKGVIHFNTTRIVKRNPTDAYDLSIAEKEAREQIYEMYTFLKNNIPAFKNATLIMSGPEIGVRESRMITGKYVLNADDILNCNKFDDSIARGAYCIDIHNPDGTGTVIKEIPEGDYYTIPYRSLIPQNIHNLLVAGRCISSTHEAQSAYRIMPIVCCIGEGAGTAIAVAFKTGVSTENVNISTVHNLLDKYNALY